MLENLKFTADGLTGQDISSLPDVPSEAGFTSEQLKARFDQIPKVLLALGNFNGLIDELVSQGASDIGITAPEGLEGATIQALIEALDNKIKTDGFDYVGDEKTLREVINELLAEIALKQDELVFDSAPVSGSTNPVTSGGIYTALSSKADKSNVLAKDNTSPFTPTSDYQPATKKYIDDKVISAGAADMQKSVYDKNGNGIVDEAEKLANAQNITVGSETRSFNGTAGISFSLDEFKVNKISLTLTAEGWTASGDNFTQIVSITGAGANSKIDLQPDVATIAALIESGTLGLYIQNNNGVFTAYAIAAAPTTALTIQATITEVV